MQVITFASIFSLSSFAIAQNVDWRDVPGICAPVCWPVVNLSQGCARTNDYINCVCNNNAAADWIPNCQACISTFWRDDTDVNSLLSTCSLTSTTWTGVSTATGSATAAVGTGGPTTTESTSDTTTTSESTGSTSSTTSTTTGTSTATRTTSTGSTTATGFSQTSGTASGFTGAAAPMATACFGMAALLMGLPVIL